MTLFNVLANLLGVDAAQALVSWARINGRTVRLPATPWHSHGDSGTRLTRVFVSGRLNGAQLLVVKYLPPEQVGEFRAHLRAFQEAPATFARHLVPPVFEPVPVAGGGVLTFQTLAGHSRAWRPMAEVDTGALPAACAAVTTALIEDWNCDHLTIRVMPAAEFLRREIDVSVSCLQASVGELGRFGPSWPDPANLCDEQSPFGRQPVDVICGRVHSDLHDHNVLLNQGDGEVEIASFVLVDLMTYASSGPLSRDPVRLLLSALVRLWHELSENQRQCLLAAVVRPDRAATGELPGIVTQILTAVYGSAVALLAPCGIETWRWQYQLTLVAQSLVLVANGDYGPGLRQWLYELALQGAREFTVEHGLPMPEIAWTLEDLTLA